jgi:hypothetical protein
MARPHLLHAAGIASLPERPHHRGMDIAGGSGVPSVGRVAPRPADLWLPLHRLAIVGLLAIAASGFVAWGLDAAFGHGFVAGDPPGVTYTAGRCADLLEYAPGARTCEQAAAEHHAGEVVQYRVATLALALIAYLTYVAIRRRGRLRDGSPVAFEPLVGATAFGVAGAGLLALSLNAFILGTNAGAGQYVSAAVVAVPAAAVYAARAYRTMRAAAATG